MLTKVMEKAIRHYRKNPQTIPIYSFEKDLPVKRIGTGGWTTAYQYDDGTGVPTVLLAVRKTGRSIDKTKDLLVKLNEQGYRPHIPIIEKLDQFTKTRKGGDPRVMYRMPLYKVYGYNDVTELLVQARDEVYLTEEETEWKSRAEIGRIYREKYLDYLKTFIDPNNPRLEQLPSVIDDLQALNKLANKDKETEYLWDFSYNNLAMDNENKIILLDVLLNR